MRLILITRNCREIRVTRRETRGRRVTRRSGCNAGYTTVVQVDARREILIPQSLIVNRGHFCRTIGERA